MRVHMVTDRFSMGGGIEHIYQVVKGLKEIEFGIFAEPGPAAQKFRDLANAKVYDRGFDLKYLLQDRPDLVHVHHLRPLVSIFKNPFTTCPVPVIFTAHGLHIHKYEFDPSPLAKLKYYLRYGLEKVTLQKAGHIIAVSREDRQFLQDKYGLRNVHYLTNGIDFAAVREECRSQVAQRKELGLPKDAFIFVTVARFNFQKGYDILLPAVARLKEYLVKSKKEIRFLFAGDGEEYRAMQELARTLSLTPYVDFLGERGDPYRLIEASDVMILPSRWEGLPIVLLETGLLKTPVLASDTYGNREIVGSENGILFKNRDVADLAKKIEEILDGKRDLERCGRNLYEEVLANYNLEKMLSGLGELYRRTGKEQSR